MRFAVLVIVAGAAVSACSGDGAGPGPSGPHLAFTIQPSTITAGQVIAPGVQVSVQDASGNPVASATPAITLALQPSSSGAILRGQSTVTAAGGVAVFSDLSITKSATSYTLTSAASGVTAATSTAFAVLPGAATAIAPAGGDGQMAGVGSSLPQPPSVLATDVFGNPVPGVAVTFAVASGGGTVAGAGQTTGSDGIAAAESWTVGNAPGPNTLSATSAGLAGSPVTFNATATPIATAVTVEVRNDFFRSVRNGSGGSSDFLANYARDTIAVGGTVTWVWVGQNHNVTPGFSGSSLSGTQNAPFTLGPITFTSPGTYIYRCTNHSHLLGDLIVGMAGIIVIR
jgi:plastocyanin